MDFDCFPAADSIQNSSLYFSGHHQNDEAYRSFHPTDAIAAYWKNNSSNWVNSNVGSFTSPTWRGITIDTQRCQTRSLGVVASGSGRR